MVTYLEHTAIATNNLEKFIEKFEKLGGKFLRRGIVEEYEAECVFMLFENGLIEFIKPTVKGNHIDRFIEKRGDGALHHIAISGKVENGVKGALPGMYVKFTKPTKDCSLLIETVEMKND